MKSPLHILFMSLMLTFNLTVISCKKNDEISPKGEIIKYRLEFQNFTSIEINNGFDAELSQSNSDSVLIETNSNILPYISISKANNKLIIKKTNDNINFSDKVLVKLYISARLINEITASGGSKINSKHTLEDSIININLQGGSTLNSSVQCSKLLMNIQGGSIASVNGFSDTLNLLSAGGSKLNSFNFRTKYFNCNVGGGGLVNITVTDKLKVTASGGSIINYMGTGIIQSQNLTGGSQLNKL